MAGPAARYLSHHVPNLPRYLQGLNPTQLSAVNFPPANSLQVLAGPGTGKTRVITSRVAELNLRHNISPSSICVVTFAKEASREMQKRLDEYIGLKSTHQLIMGTFHKVCSNYLKEYGESIGRPSQFSIWDEADCLLMLKHIIESQAPGLGGAAADIQDLIAQVKCLSGQSLWDIYEGYGGESKLDCKYETLEDIFNCYQDVLRKCGALDFEDLMVYALEVFEAVPSAIAHLEHILVDEYQDTSARQYEFIKKMATATGGRISVVGDPDQSIYGWRNSDNTNLYKMQRDFPGTHTLHLEENYRSTSSVLSVCQALISQDTHRPAKNLYTAREPAGPRVVLKELPNRVEEYLYIANEIKMLVNTSNGAIKYEDCVILVRHSKTSQLIKSILREQGIPCGTLREKSIPERPEAQNILAYLRLANSPAFIPGLLRIMETINTVPEKSIADVMARVIQGDAGSLGIAEDICYGTVPDVVPPIKHEIKKATELIKQLRVDIFEGSQPADLIRNILHQTNYDSYLKNKHSQEDYNRCRKNIDWLLGKAENMAIHTKHKTGRFPVQPFLQEISMKKRKPNTGKVTISTCHSSKGLEWPVVFVPGVVNGTYPDSRSDKAEERRVLYVAGTRAQCLLYFTHPKMTCGSVKPRKLQISEFLEDIDSALFQDDCPELDEENLQLFREILGRTSSSEPESRDD